MTDDEAFEKRWAARVAAQRAEADADYDLICGIAELEGGNAEIECTAERAEVWAWVSARRKAHNVVS